MSSEIKTESVRQSGYNINSFEKSKNLRSVMYDKKARKENPKTRQIDVYKLIAASLLIIFYFFI